MGHSHTHSHDHTHVYAPEDQRYLRLATIASVSTASILVLLKIFAWSLTGSLSLLSSTADSLMDALVSAINFVAIRYALKPADHDHRFGHNAIEDIAGLTQFAFIMATSFFIIIRSIQNLIEPEPVAHTGVGIAVMTISLLATTALVLFQRFVYKRTKSVVMAADSLHYLGDLLMNASIILSLIIIQLYEWYWLDSALAIFISLYIGWHALEIGLRSFNNLMDKEMPEEEITKIIDVIASVEGIKGFHELKTRYSGSKAFIQMHVDMEGEQTLREAHAIAETLEHALLHAFPGADVIIHQDPS